MRMLEVQQDDPVYKIEKTMASSSKQPDMVGVVCHLAKREFIEISSMQVVKEERSNIPSVGSDLLNRAIADQH